MMKDHEMVRSRRINVKNIEYIELYTCNQFHAVVGEQDRVLHFIGDVSVEEVKKMVSKKNERDYKQFKGVIDSLLSKNRDKILREL